MRIAFHTLGCKLNYGETATIREDLVGRGHEVVEFGKDMDVLVINTCSVTNNADVECRKVVRKGLRSAPTALIVVTGCYAQLQPEEIASIDGVSAVIGTTQKFTLGEKLKEISNSREPLVLVDEISLATVFNSSRSGSGDSRTRCFLKIQDGCDYICTFCTIPMARGAARAMPIDEVRRELELIGNEGYHEVVLSGINIGEYRSERGHRFVDVMNMIEQMGPPFRVRISSIEPNTVSSEIIDLLATSSVFTPHLHIPLQSGSAETLRGMKRRYNPDMYASLVRRLVGRIPHIAIGIDVITGFPGETEAQFEETVSFLNSLPYMYLHVFTYSERDRTPASSFDGKVDISVRRARTNRLRAMSARRTAEFHTMQCGTERTMIPEGFDESTGMWNGWTENHIAVLLEATFDLVKQPYRVLLDRSFNEAVYVTPIDKLEFHQAPLLKVLHQTKQS